jgi:hypothetical protein
MSRTWTTRKRGDGWVMECDSCFTRTNPRPLQDDFPLIEFADAGWSIGDKGDRCPPCVRERGPVPDPWTAERLIRDLEQTRAHSLKYYGREPDSVVVSENRVRERDAEKGEG